MVDDKIRKVLLFSLIVLFMVGIASAAGSNDTTPEHKITKTTQEQHDTVTATKNTTFEKKITTKDTSTKKATNTYTTTANNYNELVNKVNHAKTTTYDTYTINLKKGTYNATTTLNWNNTKETKLIINGNHATLDGQNKTQLMKIGNKSTVTLNNIKITNFKKNNNGGAIYSKGNLTINNSQFTNNTSRFSNGKKYYRDDDLLINNYGGAIYSTGTLIINNSQFLDNTAETNGGAIYSKGNLTIYNSQFTNNTSKNYGVKDVMQYGTVVSPPNFGGAVYSTQTLNINNSQFTNNTADWGGGAIFSKGISSINNSLFADNDDSIIGNGIIRIYNSQFIKSTRSLYFSDGNISIYDSQFRNNRRSVLIWNSIVTIHNSQFINNTVGGAISSYGGTLTVHESEFINNTVGGAIDSSHGTLTVYNSQFINNNASYCGGAISSVGNLSIYGSEFTNNNAYYGGAVYSSETLNINNSQFTNNSAKIGKSLYIEGSVLDSVLYSRNNNFTGKYSQEIKLNGGNMTINNNYFNKEKISNHFTSNLYLSLDISRLTIVEENEVNILGDNITISGYCVDENRTGGKEIFIIVNNETFTTKTDTDCIYTLNYQTKKLGKNTVSVTYNKTTEYDANKISDIFYSKTNTSMVLYKTPVATKGKVSKISGKLLSNNKGVKGADVVVDVNGKKYSAKTYSSGYFKIDYLVPTFNKRTVTVTYKGSPLYLPSTNKTTFNVKQKTKINILTKGTFTKGKIMNISGKLRLTKNNNGINGQKIIITIGSEKFNAKTDSTGYFSIRYKVKTYNSVKVKISFNGNTNYLESSNTTSFKVKQKTQITILTKNTVAVGKTVKISGKLLSNNKGVKDAKISIIIGSKRYSAKTYSSGYFTVNNVFKYSRTKIPLKFVFKGSVMYLSSNNTTSLTTVKS